MGLYQIPTQGVRTTHLSKKKKNLNENQIEQGGGNQPRPLREGLDHSWDKRAPGFPPATDGNAAAPPQFSGVSED